MSLSGCRSESVVMRGLVIDMEEARLQTLAQVTAFLDGTAEGAFRVPKAKRHRCIERMTRLSRQPVTRLVRQYRTAGTRSPRHGAPRHTFSRRFTAMDVAVLAEINARHGTVSGPATKKLMARALLAASSPLSEHVPQRLGVW